MPELADSLWLSIKEAATLYRIPVGTFSTWIQHKKLNAGNGLHHMGKLLRINRIEFEERFLDAPR